ncbi:FAD-binding protein, partial [Clostridioides difficile]|nr:FAD-binding protein [Clostridioides difficile]
HISFRVGGPADILVRPRTEEQLKNVLKLVKKESIPYLIIGNGSNILIKDGGIRGVVIELADNFNSYEINDTRMTAQSGALLSVLGKAL